MIFSTLHNCISQSSSRNFVLILCTLIILFLPLPSSAQNQAHETRKNLGIIQNTAIKEASGIACSIKNPDILWTHNDSGDTSRIFAVDVDGKDRGEFYLTGIQARDWEDIATGPGPVDGESYIYIAEIGDNLARHHVKYIYRFPEPRVINNGKKVELEIDEFDIISFQFPDGPRDAETIMVDPHTKDIYIVSKRENDVRIYRAPYPQPTTGTMILEFLTTLNLTNVNGGDISGSGAGILLKTYTAIYFWQRFPGKPLWQSFDTKPIRAPYIIEPQGEAVCWNTDSNGYFTLSEKRGNQPVCLYYYPMTSE